MDHDRAAELSAASERLRRTSGDLLDRARNAVRGSHDALTSIRVSREQWDAWKALWMVLRKVPRAQRTLRVCGFCQRVRTPGGAWVSVPGGVVSNLESRFDMLPLSHGICPPCGYEQYGVELGAEGTGG
ncbi:hypothetical protein [Longimicrobium sp.]|uniref:hypothetical protein n=1 Tax=Longimicrobium sp. TaxID=2029185 RepID=UPI002E354062|nr:hypothetical protein [Longimicrobium sp.]HEX6038666.1 hypothetical protein [Longimicrobium sp.]